MRFLILILALLCVQTVVAGDTLAQFSERLAPLMECQTVQADYVQTRKIKSLGIDLVINGSMALEKNGRLLWHSKSPLSSIIIISADSLRLWDAETNQVTTVSASRFPWLKLIYSSMSEWLSGDIKKLENSSRITIKDKHTLELVPEQEFFLKFVSKVEISFTSAYDAVKTMILFENNGDILHFEYKNIILNQTIPESRWLLPPK
ncbi:MAG: outer membrane lipoprotein carrier protein LolA [Victivallaceae bacterium]|nr:outer membrane lipoprotein carrier protein LolA [Victivallaceae bacterium]MDD4180438.1 outer membrane lipoprotein carrier protein LolA [Victivallaceae bacterium]